MMRKRIKKGSALVLALALVLSMFSFAETYAAPQINQNAIYSMELTLPTFTPDELNDKTDIVADIYKVAGLSASGVYTAETSFASLNLTGFIKDTADGDQVNEITSSEMLTFAQKAATLAENNKISPSYSDVSIVNKVLKKTELTPGLYLVNVEKTVGELNKYTFAPVLIALPGGYDSTNQTWNTESTFDFTSATVNLKATVAPREGFLVINKELLNYNTTNDSGVFVFEITGTALNEDGTDKAYNDVVAIDFDDLNSAKASDWVKIGPLKAGTTATVEEVYTGASYKVVTTTYANPQTVTITADPALDWITAEERPAVIESRLDVDASTGEGTTPAIDVEVTFQNTHNDVPNGVPNGGTGIVNKFSQGTSGWDYEAEHQGQPGPQQ